MNEKNYFVRLSSIIKEKNMLAQNLCDNLLLVRHKNPIKGPNILIAAGFHGDEPAPTWAILEFIEKEQIAKVNISFLPLVNTTGFLKRTHLNDLGENPNRGFCHSGHPSREGVTLFENISLIKELAKDGFLSLHEDSDMEEFYLYSYENSGLTSAIYDTCRRFFKPYTKGVIEGANINNGIAKSHHDGSFEDFLSHEGVRAICTETPGRSRLDIRIKANIEIIKTFCQPKILFPHR